MVLYEGEEVCVSAYTSVVHVCEGKGLGVRVGDLDKWAVWGK